MTDNPTNEAQQIERLYWKLNDAFLHPFDWMYVLDKPRFWQFRRKEAYHKVAKLFASEGFELTPEFAQRYGRNPDGWESYHLDAGGRIVCDIAYALDAQIEGDWRDYL